MNSRANDGDLREIRTALEAIRADLSKLANDPYRTAHGQEGAVDLLLNQLLEDVDVSLEKGMVHRCGMRETCKAVFTELLQKSANLVGSDSVSEELVNKYRSELEKRRVDAPKTQCGRCFGEVSSLFDKHIRLTRSMRIYRTEDEIHRAIESIPEDSVVKEILEPVSNRQRLQLLKMLSAQARPFSYLSENSGLRGGNLLFHLQRLIDAGMIMQQYERGDYLLTEKGYKVLRSITDLLLNLGVGSDVEQTALEAIDERKKPNVKIMPV